MQCPKCHSHVSEKTADCPDCGYDLTPYRSFLSMKHDLSNLRADTLLMFKQIERLEQHFAQFEERLSDTSKGSAFADNEEINASPITFNEHDAILSFEELPSEEAVKPQKRQESAILRESPLTPQKEFQETEIKLGQKWLLIAGVIATVLGVGWFLKYSFEQNWVGPAGRVMLAYLGGMIFLGVGEVFRRKDFQIFGLYLIGGGIAILYFATFAAFQIYHLMPQFFAFVVMIIITTLAGMLSLVYDTKWLAVLGLIGGFLTPVILSTGQDNQLVLMTYMTILNVGILSIAFFRQWRLLNYLGFFFTWLLFTGWVFQHYVEEKFWTTILFLNLFFLIYAFVPFVYHVIQGHRKRLSGIRIIIPNSFLALGFSFGMIEEHFQLEYVSVPTLTYAIIFLLMAQFVYRRNREQIEAFVMLLAEATFFFAITIPILFSEYWITCFWAIQSTVLFWAMLKLRNKWLYLNFVVLLVLTIGKFFWYDYTETFRLSLPEIYFHGTYMHLFTERVISSGAILLALFFPALMLTLSNRKKLVWKGQDIPLFWGGFIILLFILLNIEIGAFFYDYGSQARFAAISVLWTFFSIVMMLFGFSHNASALRKSALVLFAVTILKVFLVDMANVSTPYRVISFLVLGFMLIGASYLYHRFLNRILPSNQKPLTNQTNKTD